MKGFPMELNLPERPCKHCGVMFRPATDRALYHSPDCRSRENNAKLQKKRAKKRVKG